MNVTVNVCMYVPSLSIKDDTVTVVVVIVVVESVVVVVVDCVVV